MLQLKATSVITGEKYITYKNVLLDLDYVHFSYVNPLPVVSLFNFRKQVGTAILYAKSNVLYGDLMMENTEQYTNLYPHLSFDVYGNLYGIILSTHENRDHKIKCLEEQVTSF